jgi:hypothetical protein
MGFFSGPPKDVVFRMAQGVAAFAMEIRLLEKMDEADSRPIIQKMKAQGEPVTFQELVVGAASVATAQRMGWLRKKQYLSAMPEAAPSPSTSRPAKRQIARPTTR